MPADNDNAPVLLRVPTVCRTVEDLAGVAVQLDLESAILLGYRKDKEGLVYLSTELTIAEINWTLDSAKAILMGHSFKCE